MKRFLLAGASALLVLAAPAQARFEEGRHYMVLPFPASVETGERVEVREFFWYGCPHCYVLEPALTAWVKKIPANARFVRTPGTAPRWMVHAQAYYTFEALGAVNKLHEAFFKAVQEKPGAYSDEDAIAGFAAAHGIDRKKFVDVYRSFGVRLKVEKAKQLNQDLNISTVPSIVVDGKYLTSPTMAGGEHALIQLMEELIAKAAKERKKKSAQR